jgi:hypothetical protein
MGIYHQFRLLLLDPRDPNIVRERKERRGGLTCYSISPSLRLYVPYLLLGVRFPLHGGIGIRPLLISMCLRLISMSCRGFVFCPWYVVGSR